MKLWHGDPLRLRVRRRSILIAASIVAGVVVILVALAIWAALALIGWLDDGAPTLANVVSTDIPAIQRQINDLLPGVGEWLKAWLNRFMAGEA